jgi:hypothetical protein
MGEVNFKVVDDHFDAIMADGGAYTANNLGRGYGIVKVKATQATLDLIGADPEIVYFQIDLDGGLVAISNQEAQELWTILQAMGYTSQELRTMLGISNVNQLRNKNFRDVLNAAGSRIAKISYDPVLDSWAFGPTELVPADLDKIDEIIQDS